MTVFARQLRIGACIVALAALASACSSDDANGLRGVSATNDSVSQASAAADRAAEAADRAAEAALRAEAAAAQAAEAAEESDRITQEGLRK